MPPFQAAHSSKPVRRASTTLEPRSVCARARVSISEGRSAGPHANPRRTTLAASVADARFADLSLAQGYSVAFDKFAADAAILVTSGEVFWNRAGVNEAFAGWSPDQSLRWHPLRAGAAGSGDLAWRIGHGTFVFGIGGTEARSYSKYLTVWLRTAAGWRFLIDGGNSRPADPVP